MFRFLLLILITALPYFGNSQQRFTLNGYVRDSVTGESISGVSIKVMGLGATTLSNSYGFYAVTLPTGQYEFIISHVSYTTRSFSVLLDKESSFNFLLTPKIYKLQRCDCEFFHTLGDGFLVRKV